jgi:glycosyltransferase involved in cell wall biosynthesis
MRILYAFHSHHAGGIEQHLVTLMQGMHNRGHQVAFAGPQDSWIMDRLREQALTGWHVPYHGFFDPYSLLRLARLTRLFQPDLLHGHANRGTHYAGLVSRLTGIPCIATAHSTNACKHFGRAIHIIAVSDATRAFLISEGYDSKRVTTVHNGIAMPPRPTALIDLRGELRLPTNTRLVGVVARFIRDKGQDLALAALAQLDPTVHLILIGDDATPWGAKMRDQAVASGCGARVHFMGFRADAVQLMSSLDCLWAPSRRESLGIALIEASAQGVPAVATRVGGHPEVIIDGVNGLLVPPSDADAIAQATRRLLASDRLRISIGQAARARYSQAFTLAGMLTRTEQHYHAMLDTATA